MDPTLWKDHYKITSYLVNLRGQAGLYSILNLIQDSGWQHAIKLNVKIEPHLGWVFTRQKLTMTEWPSWNETVTIRTWLRAPNSDSAFLYRDYELFLGEKKIGECTSTFTVMDMNTRKLALVDWNKYSGIWKPEGYLDHMPAKIILQDEMQDLAQFQVRNSDIDLNNHVNNTKYAQWILDSIPIEILKAGTSLHTYEVNFLLEAKSGDMITVQKTIKDENLGPFNRVYFQGIRHSDQKPVFTATMKTFIDS